ncbi:unnamed protein product [Cylicostephanus goldi]|uniref:Kelch repeat protein n=1 Tax=Cylicostephanus goldi TaxID=71465 RepID=A0A3P7Q1D7_CYLGO|nr:unnamed protein product [Cylicostephanus goldi]
MHAVIAVSKSNGKEDLNTVECFDPFLNYWFTVPPMKVVWKNHSLLAYDNAIYAIGGENDSTALSSMEVLREGSCEWEFVEYLNTGRKEFGAAVVPISVSQLRS